MIQVFVFYNVLPKAGIRLDVAASGIAASMVTMQDILVVYWTVALMYNGVNLFFSTWAGAPGEMPPRAWCAKRTVQKGSKLPNPHTVVLSAAKNLICCTLTSHPNEKNSQAPPTGKKHLTCCMKHVIVY